jgi:hypothetical protein
MVQDYIRKKLKLHHKGQKLLKLVSRCPCNTKHHILERQEYFKMIRQHIDLYIGHMVNTKNDHSVPYNDNCLQTVEIQYQGGAERAVTRGVQRPKGGAVRFPPPPSPRTIPANNLRKTKTVPNNKHTSNKKKICHLTA